MRVAIMADLHANLEATTAVLREIDALHPDKIVCLGDLAGYNAQPNEVIELIRQREIPTVLGNHDAAICGFEDAWYFRAAAKTAIEWQGQQISAENRRWLAKAPERIVFHGYCLAVHGSPGHRDDYITDWLDAMRQLDHIEGTDIRVCFFGHSHRPSFFSEKGPTPPILPGMDIELRFRTRYFVGPGAVGQPRDGDPRAAFGLFDSEKMTFRQHRVEYDVEACARKIVEAGLPPELARRLVRGR